jgi:hypothetical protein
MASVSLGRPVSQISTIALGADLLGVWCLVSGSRLI